MESTTTFKFFFPEYQRVEHSSNGKNMKFMDVTISEINKYSHANAMYKQGIRGKARRASLFRDGIRNAGTTSVGRIKSLLRYGSL